MPGVDFDVSVVIPVYRSESTLADLHRRLAKTFGEIGGSFEIILVDDASPDNSWHVMEELRRLDPRVKIIQHMRNFGQHHAVLCGMAHSSGQIVVTMDDDLQHPPEELSKLLSALEEDEGLDVVIAAYRVKQHSWYRQLGTWLLTALTRWIFGCDRSVPFNSFRAMRRLVVEQILADQSTVPRINIMLLGITTRVRAVSVRHEPRQDGKSTYSLRRLTNDALTNIFSNSSLPLQLISCAGFGSAALSLFLGVFYLYRYSTGGIGVPGWTTVVLLILFTSGLLLFGFGVVGEYLIRILKEVRKPPRYIVRHKEL